jgi:hypothetical protein
VKFDFASLRKAVATLGDGLTGVRASLSTLRAEREQIANAPPAKDELREVFTHWVRAAAKFYEDGLVRSTLQPMVNKPGLLLDPARAQKFVSVVSASAQPDQMMGAGSIDAALCFLLGDRIIAAMSDAIERMPFVGGLPMSERAKKLKELDARIRELEAEENALLDEAREAGVVIEDKGAWT